MLFKLLLVKMVEYKVEIFKIQIMRFNYIYITIKPEQGVFPLL